MSVISTRLILIAALLGAGIQGSIAVFAMDDRIAVGTAKSADDGCDIGTPAKMQPGDCVAACAVPAADLPEVAAILLPQGRLFWPFANLNADGMYPKPNPTPPRA